jgi:predicted double-glycine peptidase
MLTLAAPEPSHEPHAPAWGSLSARDGSARVGRSRAALGLATALLLGSIGTDPAPAVAQAQVKSLLEMRQDRVVVQEWDLSCGAAALATILNHQHGDPISERQIAMQLIGREEYLNNPLLVRARHGFSLLDLKRFVDKQGYRGIGYGQLKLEDLVARAPIMVPVNLTGFNHFVVFRGMRGNRVLLADPAFGNRTMLAGKFRAAWLDYPKLGKVGFVVARADGSLPPNHLAPQPNDFVSLR